MNIEHQKTKLLSLRENVLGEVEALRSSLKNYTNSDVSGSESDQPTDDADVASALFDRERDESMLLDFEGRLEEIERALEKIEDGTYGVCDRDGKTIAPERLLAVPEATMCIECQAMEEGL